MRNADCVIAKVQPEQAELLSNLAFRSKAYWGYSDEFMQACRDELTYSEREILDHHCYCLTKNQTVTGFYIIKQLSPTMCELDALFVEPSNIGIGVGRALAEHAKKTAQNLGVKKMLIQGDPNAVQFYLSIGAVETGKKESQSIPGRYLPTFSIELL